MKRVYSVPFSDCVGMVPEWGLLQVSPGRENTQGVGQPGSENELSAPSYRALINK